MADNFVYSLFSPENVLLGFFKPQPFNTLNQLIKTISPVEIKVAITSAFFGHFGDLTRIPNDLLLKTRKDKMSGQDIWCVYECPFVDAAIQTRHLSTLINHHFYLVKKKVFLIHFDKGHMHFYIQKDGEILLYNRYPLDHEDDLMYNFSLLSQSFNVDPISIPVYLTGRIDDNSKLYHKLNGLHSNLVFYSAHNMDNSLPELNNKNHLYFDHFINIQCV